MTLDTFTLDVIDKAVKIANEHAIKPCVCSKCGKSYYVYFLPPGVKEPDRKDECKHEFISSKS